jgi:hypothetical protein
MKITNDLWYNLIMERKNNTNEESTMINQSTNVSTLFDETFDYIYSMSEDSGRDEGTQHEVGKGSDLDVVSINEDYSPDIRYVNGSHVEAKKGPDSEVTFMVGGVKDLSDLYEKVQKAYNTGTFRTDMNMDDE